MKKHLLCVVFGVAVGGLFAGMIAGAVNDWTWGIHFGSFLGLLVFGIAETVVATEGP